jgi:hypothetical protein
MRSTTFTASQTQKHLPPTDSKAVGPCWRLEQLLLDNAGTSAWPPWPSARHAFTHSHCALDPRLTRLLAGAERATCRLLASATETIPKHTLESAKPYVGSSKPPTTAGNDASCEAPPAEFYQPRGCVAPNSTTTTTATARRGGFTPTCLTRTPPVAS